MRVVGIAFVAVLLAVAGAREGLAQKQGDKPQAGKPQAEKPRADKTQAKQSQKETKVGPWEDFVEVVQGPGKKDPFQGKFDVTARMWRKPDEAPKQWTGTATLEEEPDSGLFAHHQGPDTGMADLGVGMFEDGTVWDLLYNVWLSFDRSYGTIDVAAKTLSQEGALQGHVSEEEVEFRSVLRFVDHDRFVVELWRLTGVVQPLRVLEAEYRRR